MYREIRDMPGGLADQPNPLVHGKKRFLADIVKHTDDNLVEHAARPFKHIDMPHRHRIEAAGTDRFPHPSSSSISKIRTRVVCP